MILNVLGTGSSGNCYQLIPEKGKSLMIECGLTWKKTKQGINYDLSNIAGCLLSHDHKSDHAKCPQDLINSGIKVFTSKGTAEALDMNCKILNKGESKQIGDFTVQSFDVNHDAAEPIGFLIHHEETGLILFVTDTNELNYTIPNVAHWIIEANYSKDIMLQTLINNDINTYLAGRICQNHMSLETTIEVLKRNDLSSLKSVTLIHMSSKNSSGKVFTEKVKRAIGIVPNIAKNGLKISL